MALDNESLLGLEIDEGAIKILEIATGPKGIQVLRLGEKDLPLNSFKDGVIISPKLIADTLSLFIKENNISAKKAVALINPPHVFTRIIRLPHNLSDEQIRLNLDAELSQYRLFTGKESHIDFKKLEEISEGGIKKINVLFAATLRTLSESYLKTMELVGLDLIAVDVPMLSILRLFDAVDPGSLSREVTLIILMGKKYLEMCILKGGRPRFLHSVEIDIYDFEKNRVDFIDRFVSAIKLVVNFYQARFIHGEEITRIMINPLDQKHSQIHTLLQEKLPQIPIQVSLPLTKIYLEKEEPGFNDKLKFSFSPLLGVALRIEEKDRPFNLNLLLEQRISRAYRSNQIYLIFVSLTFVFTLMIISLGWVILQINLLQRKISHLSVALKQPSLELNKAMGIKEKKDMLSNQINEALMIMRARKAPFYFKSIAKTSVLVPSELWLTDIQLEGAKEHLLLTAEAKSEKSIFDYIASLSGSNYFGSVELISSQGGAEAIKFTLRCKLR